QDVSFNNIDSGAEKNADKQLVILSFFYDNGGQKLWSVFVYHWYAEDLQPTLLDIPKQLSHQNKYRTIWSVLNFLSNVIKYHLPIKQILEVQNLYDGNVDVMVYSSDRKKVWGRNAQPIDYKKARSIEIQCKLNEEVCYGAWLFSNPEVSWGVGKDGKLGC